MIKKILISLLIFIISLEFFSLIATKLNLFIVNHEPQYLYSQGNKWRTENMLWGAWHKKNSSDKHSTKCYSVSYKSNNIGARDNINYDDTLNKNSVLLLGDSLAEGMGVEQSNIFSEVLEKLINKTVLNFGSSAHFGPLQAAILYENLASNFPHNELIFFFSPLNDFIDNNWEYWKIKVRKFRNRPYFIKNNKDDGYSIFYPNNNRLKSLVVEFYFFRIQDFLNQYTYLANALKTLNAVYSKFSKDSIYYKNNNEINLDVHSYFIKDVNSIDGTFFSLEKLFSQVSLNKKKILVLIPTEGDLERIEKGEDYKKLYWYKKMVTFTQKFSIKLIDLAEYFKSSNHKNITNSCDGHWNSDGHKLVANIIFKNVYNDNEK